MAFDQSTRNRLQKFVAECRAILTEEFTRQLQATYGLDPKSGVVAKIESLTFLDNQRRETANLLRETLAHYEASIKGKSCKERTKEAINRIIREQAFTVLNRLAALRMAEARGFLIESISKGYDSKGFQLYKSLAGTGLGETGEAYRCYLFSLFDEFSLDLAVLFDRNNVQGRLFLREAALLELLGQINHFEIEHFWAEDETIGWIYQFWNGRDEIDKMRSDSRAPRSSREMAVRNQFFTPRYIVEFLTDNTLGRIWYEMTQGKTALVENCRYLVRRPNEIFLSKSESAPESIENGELKIDNDSLSQEELLKQPVYIPFRTIKDPRELRMLDPACGSMHFGLYAFDLFEKIYEEAWQLENELGPKSFSRTKGLEPLQTTYSSFDEFRKAIPKLIIECNIHGVDIDPRAVQIAGLSLWQRAQRAWHQMGIKPDQRPTIKKSNIVCAEPMPGEKEILWEFTANLNPPVLGQLVETIFDKMGLAGEAGTLLKIEEEITSTISKAKDEFNKELLRSKEEQGYIPGFAPKLEATLFDFAELTDETSFWDTAEDRILEALSSYADQAESGDGQKRLFAEDASKGFAFIDLCRKRFDVVLMNPPFGEASSNSKKYIDDNYPRTKGDVLANFIERTIQITRETGLVGAITNRTCLFLSSMSGLRDDVFGVDADVNLCADLGHGVLDAMVEVAAYTIGKQMSSTSYFIRLLLEKEKEETLFNEIKSPRPSAKTFIINPQDFKTLNGSPYCYWTNKSIIRKICLPSLDPNGATIKVGLQTGDDYRFLRNYWEVPEFSINHEWRFYTKTDKAIPWYSPINLVVNWKNDGYQIKRFFDSKGKLRSRPQNLEFYFKSGFSYMLRSDRITPYIVPENCIPTAGRSQVIPNKGKGIEALIICASNIGSSIARFRGENFGQPKFQAGMIQQLPFINIPKEIVQKIEACIIECVQGSRRYYSDEETCLEFNGIDPKINKRKKCYNFRSLLGYENDYDLAKVFGLTKDEFEILQFDLIESVSRRRVSEEQSQDEIAMTTSFKYLSYLVGCAFGRWNFDFSNSHNMTDIYERLPSQPPVFKSDGFDGYVELNGIADLDSDKSLPRSIDTITKGKSDELEKAFTLCAVNDWNQFLSKPTEFFDYHLNQYSQNRRPSPIYWLLQTPSGSYTLWVYYHRLTEQTLYTCVNDFVEPKLKTVTDDLNGLRNKSARSSNEEKELVKLTDLEMELKEFRDELLRIAKFWKPNLNDGVQITAAPLWKLFQHKPWQKKLKETWDKLKKGEYDWAHLAYSVWPERVLRKCHEDRSLAIAHDVEDDLWEEVVISTKKGANKTKWQPRKLSENQLDELIQMKIVEARQ